MDKVKSQLDKTIEEFNLNSALRKEVFLKINELNKQMAEYEIKSKTLGKIIQEYKDIIACGDLQSTPGFDKLSQEEQNQIVKSMDKTDYTKYDSDVPRFYDLEKLVQKVLDLKTKYSSWVLKSIVNSGNDGSIPPKNYYEFTFLLPDGDYCTLNSCIS